VVVLAVPPAEGAEGFFHFDRGAIRPAVGGEEADGAIVEGLDDFGLIEGELLRRGGRLLDVGEDVGHLGGWDVAFDAFGHEGFAAAFDLVEFAARDGDFFPFGSGEREARAGFFEEDAGELAAIGGEGDVFDVAVFDGAVGIEDGGKQIIGRLMRERR